MWWLEKTRLSASMVSTTLLPAPLTLLFEKNVSLRNVLNVVGAHLENLPMKTEKIENMVLPKNMNICPGPEHVGVTFKKDQ